MPYEVTIPSDGTRTVTLCPMCRRQTTHHAAYLTIWEDAMQRHGDQFAGWQCDECGTQHSGS